MIGKLCFDKDDLDVSLASFRENGLTVVKGEAESRDFLSEAKTVVENLLEEYIALSNTKGGLGLHKENGYRELVQKDVGRYDLNLDHLIQPNSTRIFSPIEIKTKEIYHYVVDRIQTALSSILTDQYIVNAFGAVISLPNTNAQRWHVDVNHLYQITSNHLHTTDLAYLPCHFVTVFCPLFEYSEEIGPTEIALKTACRTAILSNRCVPDQYPTDEVVHWILQTDHNQVNPEVEIIKFQAELGDIGK
jgi:hypothetical protein